jgi:hypothetical protein
MRRTIPEGYYLGVILIHTILEEGFDDAFTSSINLPGCPDHMQETRAYG